jgi:hypothetical protein
MSLFSIHFAVVLSVYGETDVNTEPAQRRTLYKEHVTDQLLGKNIQITTRLIYLSKNQKHRL